MSDLLRVLNSSGIERFADYLQLLRDGSTASPPYHLLCEDEYSEPFDVRLEVQEFTDSFEFGQYLVKTLKPIDGRELAFNHALWTWLSQQ
jgi:hypothetical protein